MRLFLKKNHTMDYQHHFERTGWRFLSGHHQCSEFASVSRKNILDVIMTKKRPTATSNKS